MIKVQTRVLTFLVALTALLVLALSLMSHLSRVRQRALHREIEEEKRRSLDAAVKLKGESLKAFVSDYSCRDDLVRFMATRNRKWAATHLHAPVLQRYEASAVWVCDTEGGLVYSASSSKDRTPRFHPLPHEGIPRLLAHMHQSHFFVMTAEGLMEVRGAAIHCGTDGRRGSPDCGYFLAGVLWTSSLLDDLSTATGGKIRLIPVGAELQETHLAQDPGVVTFTHTLTGWDKRPVARLAARYEYPPLRAVTQAYDQQLALFACFAFAILVFLAVFLFRGVSIPLEIISESLQKENTAPLAFLAKDRTEFGRIAELVRCFFDQRAQLQQTNEALSRESAERKHAEDVARRTEASLRLLVEQIPEVLWSTDRELRFTYSAGAGLQALHLLPNEVVGMSLYEYFNTQDPDYLPIAVHRRALQGESLTYETEWMGRTFHSHVEPLRDADGSIVGTIGVAVDITDRKRFEEEARKSEQRYRSLFEQAPDSVVLVEPETGRLAAFNDRTYENLGYTREEFANIQLSDLEVLETPAQIMQHLEGILVTGSDSFETKQRTKSGEVRDVLVNARAIEVHGRKLIQCFWRDITEQKTAEVELREAKQTAELANRAKSEFLARMSHEIRTPMNSLIGVAGLLLQTPLTQEQREYAETVFKSGEALLNIINDLLDFSKIEAGKLVIEPVPFDLRDAVEEIVDLLAVRAQLKGIALTVDYPPETPRKVIGDAGRIRQVLVNILDNAVKFTHEGSARVAVECRREAEDIGVFRISVTDTGIGISPENMPHIFDAFTQVDRPTTKQSAGAGLGLAICKHLVELMGGQIGAASDPGKGSTFWFSLRLPLNETEQMREFEKGTPLPTAKAPRLRARILLAEDDTMSQKAVTWILEKRGCRVDVAANGQEAIDRALRFPYDLILMDCRMPDVDGYEATARIRQQEKPGTRIPIVAMTAYALPEDRRRCMDAGMDDYVSKPVRAEDLEELLRKWLPRERNAKENIDQTELPFDSDAIGCGFVHIDAATFSDLRRELTAGTDNSQLQQLVAMFLEDSPERIAELRRSAREGNRDDLITVAHTLKGASGNIGAHRMREWCERLEDISPADLPAKALDLIDELEQEFSDVQRELISFVERGMQ